jgi:LmbE family N-acetylglucosaminyl deacetylase
LTLVAASLVGAPKTILAIGAHAGDMELTCGALLARHARAGDRVVLLHLSLGEGGKPGMSTTDYAVQKRREADSVAQMLGAEVVFAPWHDGSVPTDDEAARWLAARIAEIKPTTVITHWKNSMHKDHEAAYILTTHAVLFASIAGTKTVKAVYYAENWEDPEGFQPYIYVPVEEQDSDVWRKAVMEYEFTHAAYSGFEYIRYYNGLQLARGALGRAKRAIAFDVEPYVKRRSIEALP